MANDFWSEFINKDLCSICGNWGVIDSKKVKSPAGVLCGKLNYCICPNGRKMKEMGLDIEKIYQENQKMSEWQPIETAPKSDNGFHDIPILVWDSEQIMIASYRWGNWHECDHSEGSYPIEPKMWMPLPMPPQHES